MTNPNPLHHFHNEINPHPIHKVAVVEIICNGHQLYQTHRISNMGIKTIRNFPNISETIEAGEKPLETILRGLIEELNLFISAKALIYLGEEIEIKPSPTTGIIKEYRIYKYRLDLPIEKKNSIPLVVNEEDCTIYLEWKSI